MWTAFKVGRGQHDFIDEEEPNPQAHSSCPKLYSRVKTSNWVLPWPALHLPALGLSSQSRNPWYSIFSLWKQKAFSEREGKTCHDCHQILVLPCWHMHSVRIITDHKLWLDFRTVSGSYNKWTIFGNAIWFQVLWKCKGWDEAQTCALLNLNTKTVQLPTGKVFNKFDDLKDRNTASKITTLSFPKLK